MPAKVTSTGLYIIPGPRAGLPPHSLAAAQVEALPAAPGVYIFRDRRRRPLYVGKSINIRSRVRQHLRDFSQADMLAQAKHVDAIETAGEIGALLQELVLVRQFQPPFNSMLREEGETWVLASQGPQLRVVRAAELGDWRPHAPYASRGRAEAAREQLVIGERLCPGLAGLESIHPQRGCFAHQLKRCDGACLGLQPPAAYRRRQQRALGKLEKAHWPWPGTVGLAEERSGMRQLHVIDRWDYLGSISAPAEPPPLRYRSFDPDVYRIVASHLGKAGMLAILL